MSTDNCQAGQPGGDVFFLPHTLIGSTLESSCTIGPDQWILANVGGVIWTNDDGETFEEMKPLVENLRGEFSELSATIDGVEVPHIDSYWVVSPAST